MSAPGSRGAELGKLGVWVLAHDLSSADCAALAQRIEGWGYGTFWLPEVFGRHPFVSASWLLANTSRLRVATGVANIYARDSFATLNAQYGLAEQSDGRFLLGIGVSHRPLVEGLRGHAFQSPLGSMGKYLQEMAQSSYHGPAPAEKPKTLLAALGPKMLELAAVAADGAHTYNVSPVHTAKAREILGPHKLLCPEQKVILESDPVVARSIGRRILGHSLSLPAYRNNFLRMGFAEKDLEGGGSNRFVDAIIAWGNERQIAARIQEHWDAGADHVCIQVLPRDGMQLREEDEMIFEMLAPSSNSYA